MVDEPPDVLTVTRFWPYWAPTFRLQSGVLHVAVMMAVPGATEVMVALLVPLAKATVTLPRGLEPQLRTGVMATPLVSITSAVKACVPPVESVNDVPELLASWMWMEATGHTNAGCGTLFSPETEAKIPVEPGVVAVSTPVETLLLMTWKSVLVKVIGPTVEVISHGLTVEHPAAEVLNTVAV